MWVSQELSQYEDHVPGAARVRCSTQLRTCIKSAARTLVKGSCNTYELEILRSEQSNGQHAAEAHRLGPVTKAWKPRAAGAEQA